MSYKDKEGLFHDAEILDKLTVDEPFLILRANDQSAEQFARAWCGVAEASGVNPEKINGVRQIANAMRGWKQNPETNKGVKLPD